MKPEIGVDEKKPGPCILFELELEREHEGGRARHRASANTKEAAHAIVGGRGRAGTAVVPMVGVQPGPPRVACAASAADLTITRRENEGPRTPSWVGALEPPWCRWSVCNRVPPTVDTKEAAHAIVGGRTGTAVVSLVGVHVRRHTPPHGQPLCVRPRGLGLARRCAFPPSSHATAPDTARRYASPHTRPHSNAAPSTLPLYAHTTCNILRDYPTIIEKQRPWRCTTKPTYVLFKSVEDPPSHTLSPRPPDSSCAARASSVMLPSPR